jgi:hypothetical protein
MPEITTPIGPDGELLEDPDEIQDAEHNNPKYKY